MTSTPAPGRPAGSPDPDPGTTPVRPEIAVLLVGLALVLVFLALEPFLSYALFGSDTGEYYTLTASLLSTGHLPHGAAYGGWGTSYPDFPGIYLLAGAGGGGFLLLYCPKTAQARVRRVLSGLQSLEFRFDWGGARIAFAQ